MSAIHATLTAFALSLGCMVVFGLYRLSHELGLIELHLGAIRREMVEARHDAVSPQDGSQS